MEQTPVRPPACKASKDSTSPPKPPALLRLARSAALFLHDRGKAPSCHARAAQYGWMSDEDLAPCGLTRNTLVARAWSEISKE